MYTITSHYLAKEHGMLSDDEILLIKKCCNELEEDPMIVNIGAGFGTSALAMLEERPKAFIFSIDKLPRPEERRNIEEAGFDGAQVLRILSDSGRAGRRWRIPIDLCFVDGDHGTEAVQRDMESWKPHVKMDGFMIFHDYNHPNVPKLTTVVEAEMNDWEVVGTARYMIAYRKQWIKLST